MVQRTRSWNWRLGLAGFLVVGGAIVLSGNCALAQITPDGTLGAEGSTVTPNVTIGGLPADRIDGGATRGTNLFHSFLDFNVGNGQLVYFANPVGIENILSRVTGNNLSNILGTLGIDGGANLFLLNPNGIIFGPNAKLDIGGSFVASTADSVVFDNGFAFSATNPQAPPLLTISVPIGLQFGSKAGAIRVQASLSPGEPFTEIGDAGQLPATAQAANTQPSGTALSSISGTLYNENDVDLFQIFLTGNQTFSATTVGSTASDFGGQLDTQLFLFNPDGSGIYVSDDVAKSVESYLPSGRPLTPAEPGLYYLGVSSFNNNPSSTAGAMFFPTSGSVESGPHLPKLPLSNWSNTGFDSGTYTIHLTGAHFATTTSVPGLTVRPGRTLALVGGDVLLDGVVLQAPGGRIELGGVRNSGTVGLNVEGSNLRFNFPNNVALADVSLINGAELNVVAGNGGSIAINARNLDILGRSQLLAGIGSRQGSLNSQAGDITLNATGTITMKQASLVENAVNSNAIGNGGNILITTGSLLVTDYETHFQTSTSGQGNAGRVSVTAQDNVSFNGSFAGIFSTVEDGAIGNSGGIDITTGTLSVSDGAWLEANIEGRGNAGNVTIRAHDSVIFDDGVVLSQASSHTYVSSPDSKGNSGDINITTGSLTIINDGHIGVDTYADQGGNAGNITITARDTVFVSGSDGSYRPGIFSSVRSDTLGNGGNINIITGSLIATNGARLDASTAGKGNAGNVTIHARDMVSFDGVNSQGLASAAFSTVEAGASGNGGSIDITTDSLSVTNGAQLNADTFGKGNAGSISVRVDDLFSLTSGSFISSEVLPEAVGSAGEVSVVAGSLILDTDSYISSDTLGQGNAGHVSVQANGLISLAGGSYISSDTLGQGNAGHVSVQADGLISLASSSSISSDVWSKAVGNAGEVSVVADRLTLDTDSYISSDTLGQGNAGRVSIQADDLISLANSSFISSDVWSKAVGNAGEVSVVAGRLTLDTDSHISSETRGQGNAGNIWVRADDSIFLTSSSFISSDTHRKGNSGSVLVQANNALSLASNSYISSLVSSGAIGSGGNITITVGLLSVTQGADLNTSSLGQGDAGDIVIRANSIVSFDGVGSTVFSGVGGDWSQGFVGIGNGGDIDIQAKFLSVTGGAELVAQTLGEGNAGNININTSEAVSISGVAPFPMLGDGSPGGFSSGLITSTEQEARGQGGNISVTTPNFRISDGAVLNARSRSEFRGGNITINANSLEVTGGGQILSTAFSNGDAGNITVNVTDNTTISGSDQTFVDRFNQVAQVFGEPQARFTIDPVGAESGLFANTVPGSTGKGGDIFINSNHVAISNSAKVAVDSQGQGNGGNINIQTNSLTLDDRASIVAQTASGEGGNITLQVPDILLMRHNSLISAEAGGTGNGGNIDIDAGFIVAVPKEDSDIVANAYEGRGGNINITTQGIYGLKYRPQRTPLSDITASSQFGVDGIVEINTPFVDPSQGLAQLPTNLVHAEELIDRHCTPTQSSDQRSSFTVTGRGGLPPSPNEPLRNEEVITNWITLPSEEESPDAAPPDKSTHSTNQPLVEAQGWMINDQGQVVLTAKANTVTPQISWLPSPSCPASQAGTQ